MSSHRIFNHSAPCAVKRAGGRANQIDAAFVLSGADFVNVDWMLITFSACGIGNIAPGVAANGRFFLNYFGTELALSRFTGVQRSAFGPTR
jgi:hypothetical protein